MESSEDDAGAATNASRRASAREKDVGLAEDVSATSSFQQEPSDARQSCQTPAMSEDNFDGDSVPSPSAQDVNTSTEAILDMIDEIVDGPGAPKRLPLQPEPVDELHDQLATTGDTSHIAHEPTKNDENDKSVPSEVASPAADVDSEGSQPAVVEVEPQTSPCDELPQANINTDSANLLEASLPITESVNTSEATVSAQLECSETSSVKPEVPADCPPNIPSSSEEQTVQRISDSSECETQERTVKCVTSSATRDNVTVESAESTSSDSVSEGKPVLVEPQTRSPLRRRLVRPVVCDRRPDSTVSSTVDSQTQNVLAAELIDSIAKDVSSSSDAVPNIHGNVKPEEIRNISEISICKAETSVSPPKKIKLIRQKIITGSSNRETPHNQSTVDVEKDQCQSTSTDKQSSALPEAESSGSIDLLQPHKSAEKPLLVKDTNTEPVADHSAEPICSDKHSQPNSEQVHHSPKRDDNVKERDNQQVPPIKPSLPVSNFSGPAPDPELSSIALDTANLSKLNSSETKSDTKLNHLEQGKKNDVEHSSKIVLEQDQKKVLPLNVNLTTSSSSPSTHCDGDNIRENVQDNQKKVPPIKLNLSLSSLPEPKAEGEQHVSVNKSNETHDELETKQVPKLTIKLKQSEEMKSPVPKLTIKPIRPPLEQDLDDITDNVQPVPSVTRLNIKPILKPPETNEKPLRTHQSTEGVNKLQVNEQIPCITKLNIKPIRKPPEKINDVHRKSSSSEISESEYSENDESTSTSDQASASEQGPSDVVPKVTIKLGKPGTHCEGKFYTEQNIPKLTIKGIQQVENEEEEPKLKLVISQSEEKQPEKVPKLTIKTVGKSESQPLSPKLTIKPLRPPDSFNKESEIPKMKISTEFSEARENAHVPKITIKPVTRSDTDTVSRTPKKSATVCDSPEHIPVVTKLNIKPILKPMDCGEMSEGSDDKVPVVSKLNIKPVIKPKDNDLDSSVDDVPKITKLNIKPIKNPEENSSEEKDCDELNADIDANSIPVITKLNIKPIVKPQEDESLKDTENQSSETGTSSDENTDHIPIVTKLNIKPILKPDNLEESSKSVSTFEPSIPVITKLNIKPLIKPGDSPSPSSPKKEHLRSPDLHSTSIPIVTKLNIKPVVKPDDAELHKSKDDTDEKPVKHPPLVMKINMKSVIESVINESQLHSEYKCNNISEEKISTNSKSTKSGNELEINRSETISSDSKTLRSSSEAGRSRASHSPADKQPKQNCISGFRQESEDTTAVIRRSSPLIKSKATSVLEKQSSQESLDVAKCDSLLMIAPLHDGKSDKVVKLNEVNEMSPEVVNVNIKTTEPIVETNMVQTLNKPKFSSVQNCTLLKKLLENTKEGIDRTLDVSKQIVMNCAMPSDKPEPSASSPKNLVKREQVDSQNYSSEKICAENVYNIERRMKSPSPDKINDTSISTDSIKLHKTQEISENDNVTKPLEITISDKITNQSSGQDSPRIILKINKTDHGSSAKIITEDTKRPDTLQQTFENTQDVVNDKSPKRQLMNSRRKQASDTILNLSAGKRLRSSRIVENTEKTPIARRNLGKRPSITETSPPQSKEPELSVLQSKRIKLGQLLSGNKSLTITPVSISTQTSPTKTGSDMKQGVKTVNHSLLNNENCSKNGNSKLHNILSNLQAKQMQTLSYNNANCSEKTQSVSSPVEVNSQQSTGSSDTVEITLVENSHPELQEMIINENSDFRDFSVGPEESSQDPLEVPCLKTTDGANDDLNIPKAVEVTPQPKKRGRPRKLPLSEGAKPLAAAKTPAVTLPVTALEERPQRSLRLMRDRPAILSKPRGGRGRGRGGRRAEAASPAAPEPEPEPAADIDPTSSRVKLPRMTEALDKMPAATTPLSSRLPGDAPELKVVLEATLPSLPKHDDSFTKSPEAGAGVVRGRGSRGGRGRPGRTPRGRGRGRGGGRGAMYMKETMGIYGRVCGPATTTVQLFEEETCMMDDNATPAKPSHLLDEDSQSSVKSSTNESSKMKKSKFADLFDSNKVWTAADVKEYMWPPPERPDTEPKVMMIQEQVAMFLGVKSFKRRYPELQRRAVAGAERDHLLARGLVTQPLCDLGITAVDASEVLDIMLSDYPHKYEEYRSHQRERQLNATEETVEEVKTDEKVLRVEMKVERLVDTKPEVPKVDPEKTRQDMAAAAIASASEWNARVNAGRRSACVDLQSLVVQRPRARLRPPPRAHVRPPAGFYPHALLPGQYQHWCRLYTPEQLRYFPLNTVVAAPPSPADSSSDSEPDWTRYSDSDQSDPPAVHAAKRRKVCKAKGGQAERERERERERGSRESEGEAATCRACGLRLEANRRYTHERFLVCAHCNAKLHPGCVELSADTIRKCREYAWQCAECKSCCACRQPADDDKMLFCDLCDRGFHIYCVGLDNVPSGRWHCVECSICKSCGARSPGGLAASTSADTNTNTNTSAGTSTGTGTSPAAEWHHQTRRGPGGHKVYSHSLCTPCARAYRIGRYCPLCERSFIGPKGTMQLVICKLCDRQLHQDCVKQTVSVLRVLDYTCGECRRGGITSRAAAVRLAPRTIATLFMAKRRFNKYAHRQYMESRRRDAAADAPDPRDAPDTLDARDALDPRDPRDPLDPRDASESEGGGDGDGDASDPLDGAGDP